MSGMNISTATREDISGVWNERWGGEPIVISGECIRVPEVYGYKISEGRKLLGLITVRESAHYLEIVSLDSFSENKGIGSALIEKAAERALETDKKRVVLTTTNDNTKALGFYQRQGFVISSFKKNGAARSRRLKPSIPLWGDLNIPIRDEIGLELLLKKGRTGLKKGKVEILSYDPGWRISFIQEKIQIASALGRYCCCIEHIGSTSVPGMEAKPVIDILIGAGSSANIGCIVKILEDRGYEHSPGASTRERVFLKRTVKDLSLCHLHIVKFGSKEWNKHILFRNILRRNEEAFAKYLRIKRSLAENFRVNREKYTEAKSEIIGNILKRGL